MTGKLLPKTGMSVALVFEVSMVVPVVGDVLPLAGWEQDMRIDGFSAGHLVVKGQWVGMEAKIGRFLFLGK